ncbi:MAG: hypothetical protein WD750_05745 [Gammaproteobacteria bacterium]
MAIVDGILASDPILPAAIALAAEDIEDVLSVTRTIKTVPVPVTSNIENGAPVPMYYDRDWADRLHAIPGSIQLGTIRQPVSDQAAVYNAGDTDASITDVAKTGDTGITINHPATPFPIEARKSALYDVDVTLDGPEIIDALIVFDSDTDAVLIIQGSRLVAQAWPVPPEWSESVIERWIWRTDLQRARAGNEVRTKILTRPRRGLSYRVAGEHVPLVDALLSGWQSRLFNVPRWMDRARLNATASAGEITLAVDTGVGEWRIGSQLVLIDEDLDYEAPVIEAIEPDAITIQHPLSNTWPEGTSVYPARLMYIDQEVGFSRRTDAFFSGELEFIADEDTATTYEAAESETTFDGLPVYLVQPNWARSGGVDYARAGVRIDAPGGLILVDDPDDDPIQSHRWRFNFWTRDDADGFIAWLLARAGRLNAFRYPTWSADMVLTGAIEADESVLRIEPINWSNYYDGRANRNLIAVEDIDDEWHFAYVLAGDVVGDEETLTLDRALTDTRLTRSEIRRVCWLETVRLDSDAIEIAWITDDKIQAMLTMRAVE